MPNQPKKLLVICGPTAAGKTNLGLKLASLFNGEIISCDSRQIYQGMDIVTGKDRPAGSKKKKRKIKDQTFHYYLFGKIPVWGLDLVRPDKEFSAAHWVQYSQFVIKSIWQRKKLPIIVGGTGFWIKALLEKIDTIGVVPDYKLRKALVGIKPNRLFTKLKQLDAKRAKQMNQSDRKNPRRLVRAIEVATHIKGIKNT